MSGAEDWDFWITASELGLTGLHLTRALYLHRRWPGTMSETTSVADDATNRESLYRRHKATFDSFDGTCPRCPPRHRVAEFRAMGYVNSSTAARVHGQRLRSIRLAARAITILPSRRTFGQLARAVLPRPIRSRDRQRSEFASPTSPDVGGATEAQRQHQPSEARLPGGGRQSRNHSRASTAGFESGAAVSTG